MPLPSNQDQGADKGYRRLGEELPVGIIHSTPAGVIIYANPCFRNMLGYTEEELGCMRAQDLILRPQDRREVVDHLGEEDEFRFEYPLRHKDGYAVWVRGTVRGIRDQEGRFAQYRGFVEDITERKRQETRQLAGHRVRDEVWKMRTPEDIQQVLKAMRDSMRALEIPFENYSINTVDITEGTGVVHFDALDEREEWIEPSSDGGDDLVIQIWDGRKPVYRRDLAAEDVHREREYLEETYGHPVRSALDVPFSHGTLAVNSSRPSAFSEVDIASLQMLAEVLSEGFRRLDDLRALEEKERQLRRAQKMETIGQLASGVAHDFNNLITVINGYSQLMLMDLAPDDVQHASVQEVKKAGEQAATLVRQLLVFSRRQVLRPEILDLNQVVGDMEKMLRRVIGENIELVTVKAPDLDIVEADPGQLEQVLMNLAINARDAMPEGGRLTIETANAELDERYTQQHVDVPPGPYVLLSVSDTGVGMDAETQARIFEPFFTTKEHGEGTGLGLSTVYGILRQIDGYIWVDSEPGRGTTFRIYLPRGEEEDADARQQWFAEAAAHQQGEETILVVEDDETVRRVVRKILRRQGYTVVEAQRGEQALQVCARRQEPVHLLLTDVVMPGINGRELAAKLRAVYPEVKVLYMSGYAENIISRAGGVGAAFIQKPFSPDSLVRKVHEVLGTPRPEDRGTSQTA